MFAECQWNKTWSPSVLPDCTATACQDIPFPPKEIGFVYSPDAKNNITLTSGKHPSPRVCVYQDETSVLSILSPGTYRSIACNMEKV